MVDKKAAASGAWSSTATWDGGTLPLPGDDVYANNFTVDIDQDVTVNSLRNVAGTGISSGGLFQAVGTVEITITAGIQPTHIHAAAYDLMEVPDTAIGVTINGDVNGSSGANGHAIYMWDDFVGTLTINGDVIGGPASGAFAIEHDSDSGTLAVIGNVSATASAAIKTDIAPAATPIVSITGNVTGGTSSNVHAVDLYAGGSIVTVNGSVYGGAGDGSVGIFSRGPSDQISVYGGVVSGGDGTGSDGIYINSATSSPGGALRIDAELRWTAGAPFYCYSLRAPMIASTGDSIAITMRQDVDWPDDTGSEMTLAPGGGGGGTIPTSGVIWPPRYYG